MNAELDGKIVLVSGGAGGIGSAISKSFAKQGAKDLEIALPIPPAPPLTRTIFPSSSAFMFQFQLR
jgi:nucleoside-diphosphate-sugar epimerase